MFLRFGCWLLFCIARDKEIVHVLKYMTYVVLNSIRKKNRKIEFNTEQSDFVQMNERRKIRKQKTRGQ